MPIRLRKLGSDAETAPVRSGMYPNAEQSLNMLYCHIILWLNEHIFVIVEIILKEISANSLKTCFFGL